MMPFVGIFMVVAGSFVGVQAGVAARTVDALEQRWRGLEHTWHDACVDDDHLVRSQTEQEMRELLGAVHVLKGIVASIPLPTLSEKPNETARSLRDNGKALMWEGAWNTICGTALQACVEARVNGEIGSLLTAVAIIWKIYGIAQIGMGGIQLLSSVFALPRATIAARLADLEEDIELFMQREGIGL